MYDLYKRKNMFAFEILSDQYNNSGKRVYI